YAQGPVGLEREEEELRLDRFKDRQWNNAPFLEGVARCLMAGNRFADAEIVLDRVLQALQPGYPEALLRRARCRQSRRNTPGAVEDLQAYLRLPGLPEEQVLAALRQLHRLAPEHFDDLRNSKEVRAMMVELPPWFTSDQFRLHLEDPPPWSLNWSKVN